MNIPQHRNRLPDYSQEITHDHPSYLSSLAFRPQSNFIYFHPSKPVPKCLLVRMPIRFFLYPNSWSPNLKIAPWSVKNANPVTPIAILQHNYLCPDHSPAEVDGEYFAKCCHCIDHPCRCKPENVCEMAIRSTSHPLT